MLYVFYSIDIATKKSMFIMHLNYTYVCSFFSNSIKFLLAHRLKHVGTYITTKPLPESHPTLKVRGFVSSHFNGRYRQIIFGCA